MLHLIGREKELFTSDIDGHAQELNSIVSTSSFLVLGAAGTIGQAVTKEIFKRNPTKLHIVDISENNLVELVRDIRSTYGHIHGDFKTFALDVGSIEYECFIESDGKYDYVLNLSALKHVRSEEDPFTLMRMIEVNIFNTVKTINQSIEKGSKKYFCVSTDKAANPVNMMGASKRIMEMFLFQKSHEIEISTARFANVAFSDGSLLYGFNQRLQKRQPIVAPADVQRYFVTQKESGELCLMSCIFGENRDIFFPKLNAQLHLLTFPEIVERYLADRGYVPYLCKNEEEARALANTLPLDGSWPCLFTDSNTTGEKQYEEFFTEAEDIDDKRFDSLGIIKNGLPDRQQMLISFNNRIAQLKERRRWSKKELVNLFQEMIPEFDHIETGKYLDSKM